MGETGVPWMSAGRAAAEDRRHGAGLRVTPRGPRARAGRGRVVEMGGRLWCSGGRRRVLDGPELGAMSPPCGGPLGEGAGLWLSCAPEQPTMRTLGVQFGLSDHRLRQALDRGGVGVEERKAASRRSRPSAARTWEREERPATPRQQEALTWARGRVLRVERLKARLAQAEVEMENAVARALEVGMPVEAVTLRDRVGGQG